MQFHHHPDGRIIIRGDGRPYIATLAEFQGDCQALGLPAYPGLPEGWTERTVTEDRDILRRPDHADDADERLAGADAYLAAYPALLAADDARELEKAQQRNADAVAEMQREARERAEHEAQRQAIEAARQARMAAEEAAAKAAAPPQSAQARRRGR
jgi:hypothetical protein